jgi:hypothetical protein
VEIFIDPKEVNKLSTTRPGAGKRKTWMPHQSIQ